MDINTAFSNGKLREEVYVSQQEGFVDPKKCKTRVQAEEGSLYLKAGSSCLERRQRYPAGIMNMGLWYSKDTGIVITTYADANHAGVKTLKEVPLAHSRSNHIDVRYHFIKEKVKNGVVVLYFVRTLYQLADMFTKALARERFKFLINRLRMKSMSLEILKSMEEEEEG
ncbi:hypothetical protein Tco_1408020 [Tanacetum coccineum]